MHAFDAVANVAFFVQEKTGSVLGTWKGNLAAAEQRKLFGRFLGKGRLYLDGAQEEVVHVRKVCFGQDFEDTHYRWRDLGTPLDARHNAGMEQFS